MAPASIDERISDPHHFLLLSHIIFEAPGTGRDGRRKAAVLCRNMMETAATFGASFMAEDLHPLLWAGLLRFLPQAFFREDEAQLVRLTLEQMVEQLEESGGQRPQVELPRLSAVCEVAGQRTTLLLADVQMPRVFALLLSSIFKLAEERTPGADCDTLLSLSSPVLFGFLGHEYAKQRESVCGCPHDEHAFSTL